MDPICQRCYELIVGNAYRVTNEEEGITMLDIGVCSRCQKGFTFIRRKSMLGANKHQLETYGITVRDSAFRLCSSVLCSERSF
jgi:hypothetical protein